jgi:DNA helicase II / ATP-dependent DNA helicase PcrA
LGVADLWVAEEDRRRRVQALHGFLPPSPASFGTTLADLHSTQAGDRVHHQKFGRGSVTDVDGNKLTIQFDTFGEKRVVDSFVRRLTRADQGASP